MTRNYDPKQIRSINDAMIVAQDLHAAISEGESLCICGHIVTKVDEMHFKVDGHIGTFYPCEFGHLLLYPVRKFWNRYVRTGCTLYDLKVQTI